MSLVLFVILQNMKTNQSSPLPRTRWDGSLLEKQILISTQAAESDSHLGREVASIHFTPSPPFPLSSVPHQVEGDVWFAFTDLLFYYAFAFEVFAKYCC